MLVPAPRRSPTNLSHTPKIWASIPRGRSLAADKVVGQTGGRASGRASNARAAGHGEAERGRAGGRGREGKGGRAGRGGRKEEGRGRGNIGNGGEENPGSGGGSELWVGGRCRGPEGSGRASGARKEQRSTARNMDTPRIYSGNKPYGNSPISLLPLHTNLMKLAVIHIPTDICGADWDCGDYRYAPPPPIPAIVEMERAFSASMQAEANLSVCEWLRGIT